MSKIADYYIEELQADYEVERWLCNVVETIVQCGNCGYFNGQQVADAFREVKSIAKDIWTPLEDV